MTSAPPTAVSQWLTPAEDAQTKKAFWILRGSKESAGNPLAQLPVAVGESRS